MSLRFYESFLTHQYNTPGLRMCVRSPPLGLRQKTLRCLESRITSHWLPLCTSQLPSVLFSSYRLKRCFHRQQTAADIPNIATQHQVCSPYSCGSPLPHRGPWGLPTLAHRGERELVVVGVGGVCEAATDGAVHRLVVGVSSWVFISRRLSKTKLSVRDPTSCRGSFLRRAFSCVWTSDSLDGRKCGIHLALRSSKLEGTEEIFGSGYGGRIGQHNKISQ